MDKTSEIELLDRTIATFGTQSYIGPWLAEYRTAIVEQIKNDLSISVPLPNEAKHIAIGIINEAKAEAGQLTARTVRSCNDMTDRETERCEKMREALHEQLHKAMHALSNW